MGKDIAEAHAVARRVFDDADQILGLPLSQICFEGPAERLNATDISQPAIFVTSVAMWRVMSEKGIAADLAPAAMAGLSLGEYTALHLAGWIDFEACLRLVARRGQLMQAAAESTIGGMVSIMNLSEEQTISLCREAAQGEPLGPANYNCPGQIVISGAQTACRRAVDLAEKHGGRGIPLVVAGAFHSPLMESAAVGLTQPLTDANFKSSQIPVVSNVTADYHGDPTSVRSRLREQVAQPIRWEASMRKLIADGIGRFVEVGPGRVLSGLMRKIDRSVRMLNFSSAANLDQPLN